MKKIAFITQRESVNENGILIDVLENTYIKFLQKMDFMVIPISNYLINAEKILDLDCDKKILVISGGGSVPKSFYTIDNKREIGFTNRDRVEKKLVEKAVIKKIPTLAICRGMQFVCGLYGGKISKLENEKDEIGKDHQIIYNKNNIFVNNYHNDGILESDLPDKFELLCKTRKNIVEAYFFKNILGIQWHPERKFEHEEGYQFSLELIEKYILERM